MDFLDQIYGKNYISDMLSSSEEPDLSIDPSFLKKDKFEELLDELVEQNKSERKKREEIKKRYEEELNTPRKIRENEYFNQLMKRQWGFTPDKGVKKVLGTALDTILTLALPPLGYKQIQAGNLAEQDYNNNIKGYKDLLTAWTAEDKVDNQANNIALAQLVNKQKANTAQQDAINRNVNTARGLDIRETQGNKSLEIREKLANSQMSLNKILEDSRSTDTATKQYALDTLKKLDSINPNFPMSTLSKFNKDQMNMLVALGVIDENTANNYYSATNEYTKATTKPKDADVGTRVFPEYTTNELGDTIIKGIKTFQYPKGSQQVPYTPNYRRNVPQTSETIKEDIMTVLTGKPTAQKTIPTTQQVVAPITQQAKPTTDQTPIIGESVETLYNRWKSVPRSALPNPTAPTAKMAKDIRDNRTRWADLSDRASGMADTLLGAIKEGKAKSYMGPLNRWEPIRNIRNTYGKPVEELINDINEKFMQMDHLRFRLGGRPAYGFAKELESTLSNKWDNPENAAKRLLGQVILIDMGREVNTRPDFVRILDKLNEDYNKNPNYKNSIANVTIDLINNSVNAAKNGKDYPKLTPDFILDEVIKRRKTKGETQKDRLMRVLSK
jgi:hypothetical protein